MEDFHQTLQWSGSIPASSFAIFLIKIASESFEMIIRL